MFYWWLRNMRILGSEVLDLPNRQLLLILLKHLWIRWGQTIFALAELHIWEGYCLRRPFPFRTLFSMKRWNITYGVLYLLLIIRYVLNQLFLLITMSKSLLLLFLLALRDTIITLVILLIELFEKMIRILHLVVDLKTCWLLKQLLLDLYEIRVVFWEISLWVLKEWTTFLQKALVIFPLLALVP